MKTVYICSPFRGDEETNIANARLYSQHAVSCGAIPIAVHLLFPQFLDDSDPKQRKIGINMGLEILEKCDEMWVFGEPTSGMKLEMTEAKKLQIPIEYPTLDFCGEATMMQRMGE